MFKRILVVFRRVFSSVASAEYPWILARAAEDPAAGVLEVPADERDVRQAPERHRPLGVEEHAALRRERRGQRQVRRHARADRPGDGAVFFW